MTYPLHFPEKAPKGTKQGDILPEASIQGREIGIFLAFSQYSSSIKRIEQDLRRRVLYQTELLRHVQFLIKPKKRNLNPFGIIHVAVDLTRT